jgi:ferrochelatase
MAYRGDSGFLHGTAPALGVLVTNLGTPEAPTTAAVRRYLAEFLSDPRVVEMPRWLWRLILHGVILRVRPRRSAEAYHKVWSPEGSPLLTIARRQVAALAGALGARLPGPVRVALGMRYGQPSIAAALEELRAAGVRRLLVLPLYPQYSATTTGSTFDAVAATLGSWRWLPELRFVTHYHDDPGYLDALAQSVREAWTTHGEPDRVLCSFHGLPRRYLAAGDPYHCECQKTARLLAERLGLAPGRWAVSFQSRVGREEWLKPYTDHLLKEWGAGGVAKVQVICPGFSADCLETLEEIDQQNRGFFLQAGGSAFHYVPALNERADHIRALADLVCRHVQGWPEADPGWAGQQVAAALAASRERALGMGAAR